MHCLIMADKPPLLCLLLCLSASAHKSCPLWAASDGSSRLCFELRKNEAQNLCRAFDKAGNVQVASTLSRIADPAALGGLAWCGIPKAYSLG